MGENVVRQPNYQNRQFTLWVEGTDTVDGVSTLHLRIRDRFTRIRHRPHRILFTAFVHQLESYLRRHPEMDFAHPGNRARSLIYMLPGLRAWSVYMPGGFATHPVHNPDVKRLHTGKRIDYLTRNLFRHSFDAIGLRSRAYAMAWYVLNSTAAIKKRPVRWLSIAAGTGQPTYEAARLLATYPSITLSDRDDTVLAAARKLADSQGIGDHVTCIRADITEKGKFVKLLEDSRPDIVDMMGLAEYLDARTLTTLIRTFYHNAESGSFLVFTNMRPSHPHLQTHKRGLGWPGVIVRTVSEVVACVDQAKVPHSSVEVMLPDDQVYAIYCIKKP